MMLLHRNLSKVYGEGIADGGLGNMDGVAFIR